MEEGVLEIVGLESESGLIMGDFFCGSSTRSRTQLEGSNLD